VLVQEEGEDASMQCRRNSKVDRCRKAKGEEVVEEDRCFLRNCLIHRAAGAKWSSRRRPDQRVAAIGHLVLDPGFLLSTEVDSALAPCGFLRYSLLSDTGSPPCQSCQCPRAPWQLATTSRNSVLPLWEPGCVLGRCCLDKLQQP
jgi:hypothetical protein